MVLPVRRLASALADPRNECEQARIQVDPAHRSGRTEPSNDETMTGSIGKGGSIRNSRRLSTARQKDDIQSLGPLSDAIRTAAADLRGEDEEREIPHLSQDGPLPHLCPHGHPYQKCTLCLLRHEREASQRGTGRTTRLLEAAFADGHQLVFFVVADNTNMVGHCIAIIQDVIRPDGYRFNKPSVTFEHPSGHRVKIVTRDWIERDGGARLRGLKDYAIHYDHFYD